MNGDIFLSGLYPINLTHVQVRLEENLLDSTFLWETSTTKGSLECNSSRMSHGDEDLTWSVPEWPKTYSCRGGRLAEDPPASTLKLSDLSSRSPSYQSHDRAGEKNSRRPTCVRLSWTGPERRQKNIPTEVPPSQQLADTSD